MTITQAFELFQMITGFAQLALIPIGVLLWKIERRIYRLELHTGIGEK